MTPEEAKKALLKALEVPKGEMSIGDQVEIKMRHERINNLLLIIAVLVALGCLVAYLVK